MSARTPATWRTCSPIARSRTTWRTCRGCWRSSRAGSRTTSTPRTSPRSSPWSASRPRGASRSSTTTRTSRRARRSTASPGPFLGVAYDGLGMGDDGTFWGGELFVADLGGLPAGGAVRPGAHARRRDGGQEAVPDGARLPAGRRGRGRARSAWAPTGPSSPPRFLARLDPTEVGVVRLQVARGLNAPVASSAGRLFDAVSSLLGPAGRGRVRGAGGHRPGDGGGRSGGARTRGTLPYRLDRRDGLLVYDPRPTLPGGARRASPAARRRAALAARFQRTIVEVTRELLAAVARGCRHPRRVPVGRGVPERRARGCPRAGA